MIFWLKKHLYFFVAWYFRFFAVLRLNRWSPKIILVTGSNGKTTLLHLLAAQLGGLARYTFHANSSFGIPFNILNLERKTLLKREWFGLFLKAPINVFLPLPKEKIFVVEADVDRPGEGRFLASFLRPEVVLWVGVARTHGMNFENLVAAGRFGSVVEAIAYEFGYFLEYCRNLAVINGDIAEEVAQEKRARCDIVEVKKKGILREYSLGEKGTVFRIDKEKYVFKDLLPEEIFYGIKMCKLAIEYLGEEFDTRFENFKLPPGRSSLFKGIWEITIVDSCYNANLSSMRAILKMFVKFESKHKWVVLGDMLEQGEGEREEHERLAELIDVGNFERVVLMGPRVSEYTYPKLLSLRVELDKSVERFLGPKETLDYLLENLKGGETILFKGARFMEGIIENLLFDKKDVAKLSRREEIWEKRRKNFGL